MTSRDKLLAVLATVDFRGITIIDAAKKAGVSVSTVKRVLEADDGTIRAVAHKYPKGGGFYAISAYDKIMLKTARPAG